MKSDWESCLLGDLIEINQNNIGKNHAFENICYVDISSVGSGTISYENVIKLSDAPSRAKRLAVNGDTIISTVRPGNRSFAFLKKCPINSVYSTGFAVLHPNQDKINPRFLYYTVSDYSFTGYLTSVEKGASYPSIDTNDIKSAQILIPNIKNQNKIASILSAYDDLIENNLKRIKLLEEKAQLTYEEWFVRMKYPGHENDSVDSETGLPEGWSFQTIGVLTNKLESGKRPKGGIDKSLNQGVPSIGAENVNGLGNYNYSKEKYITEEYFSTMNKGIIENKDILVYKDGAYIGKVAMFQDSYPHEKCCVNEHVFLLNTGEEILQNLLYFTLETKDYFKKMQGLNSNSAQPGINQTKLKSLEIVLPKHELCKSFYIVTEPLLKLISTLALQNESLKLSRDLLLPRLISGMIDIDEVNYKYPKETFA